MKHALLIAVFSIAVVAGCTAPAKVKSKAAPAPAAQWHEMHHAQPPGTMENATFLGVQAAPVGPALREQLGLAPGTGLVVEEVLPNSPAASVRLARFDVLTRLNDQTLVNAEQLMVLVRDFRPGQTVRLTVIRHAREAVIPVRLAARPMPAWQHEGPMTFPGRPWGREMTPGMGQRGFGPDFPGHPWEREMAPGERGGMDGWRGRGPGMMGPHEPGMGGPGMNRPGMGNPDMGGPGMGRPGMRRPNGPAAPGPHGGMGNVPPRADGNRFTFKFGEDGTAVQVFEDNEYALHLTRDAKGNKTLVARNLKNNQEVFRGPVNTPQERAKLPPPVARRLEMMVKANINVVPGRNAPNAPPGNRRTTPPSAPPGKNKPVSVETSIETIDA